MSTPVRPPTPVPASSREMTVSHWSAYESKTLRGFFRLELPSGMIINDCMLHEKSDGRWIGFPGREYEDKQTHERKFAKIIEFRDRPTADRFKDQVLAALDRHLAEVQHA